jgi:FtsP/CotA-like multicopper oxidase with cupredoxin domain
MPSRTGSQPSRKRWLSPRTSGRTLPYVNPATETLNGVVDATPISNTTDGTQIWKITHNGVDTHPIHWHLFDVQVINRVGWDGIIRKPDANELGWKDTLRVSPLEDTIVAVRPILFG